MHGAPAPRAPDRAPRRDIPTRRAARSRAGAPRRGRAPCTRASPPPADVVSWPLPYGPRLRIGGRPHRTRDFSSASRRRCTTTRTTAPAASTAEPATTDAGGRVRASTAHPRAPATGTQPRVPPGTRCEPARGQIGQQVVRQHRQRREADGPPQVDHPHEDEHHQPDGELGAVRDAGSHDCEPARQVPVAGHGEGRAGHAQQERQQGPGRRRDGSGAHDGNGTAPSRGPPPRRRGAPRTRRAGRGRGRAAQLS